MKNDNDYRKHLAIEVRKEIHGPLVTDENNFKTHVIPDPPNQYFSCGILYPANSGIQSSEVDDTLDTVKQDFDGSEESELNFGNDSRKKHDRTVDNIEADEQTDIDLTSQMTHFGPIIYFRIKNLQYHPGILMPFQNLKHSQGLKMNSKNFMRLL